MKNRQSLYRISWLENNRFIIDLWPLGDLRYLLRVINLRGIREAVSTVMDGILEEIVHIIDRFKTLHKLPRRPNGFDTAIIRVLRILFLCIGRRDTLFSLVDINIRQRVIWSIWRPVKYCFLLSIFRFEQFIVLLFLQICVRLSMKGSGDLFFHLTNFVENFSTELGGNRCNQIPFRQNWVRYCVEKFIA